MTDDRKSGPVNSQPRPRIIHHNGAWVDAYENGWAQLACAAEGRPWTIYCARYAWGGWPVESTLDNLYTKNKAGREEDPLLAWLELALFRLTGNRERLQRVFPLCMAALPVPEAKKTGDRLRGLVHDRALNEIARILDQPLPKQGQPTAGLDLSTVVGERPHPLAEEGATAAWVENCLLCLWLLRAEQEADQHQHLSQLVANVCVERPALHCYLPPLLLDGVVGCQPNAGDQSLTWWLYTDPPIGVEHYRLGDASLSLHAEQERGAGTRLSVETNAPLTLEIVTPERSYLEILAAGQHEMLLTVLDRTDVR
jgi:hypothetical protein